MSKQKLSKEERSERMRQAWVTRRANMANVRGSGPVTLSNSDRPNGSRDISFQIPSIRNQEDVNNAIAEQFFEYLKFATANQDSGILRTERFKILAEHVKSQIFKK